MPRPKKPIPDGPAPSARTSFTWVVFLPLTVLVAGFFAVQLADRFSPHHAKPDGADPRAKNAIHTIMDRSDLSPEVIARDQKTLSQVYAGYAAMLLEDLGRQQKILERPADALLVLHRAGHGHVGLSYRLTTRYPGLVEHLAERLSQYFAGDAIRSRGLAECCQAIANDFAER